jgi:Zn-finger domain-containing protein
VEEEMTTHTPLLHRTTELLDSLTSKSAVDLPKLTTDLHYFKDYYLSLQNNLSDLKDLKDEMEQKGFDSPYFTLGTHGKRISAGKVGYEDIENQRDISRHKKLFIADASYKKSAFERTKGAIAANNIAVGHLEEFISIKCSCGKTVKGKEALKILDDNHGFLCDKCGSVEGEIIPNEYGIYRLEIVSLLPFGGEFMSEISKFTPTERRAYREIIGALREQKKSKIKSAMVFFKKENKGKWVRKKELVELGKTRGLDVEGILKEKYGKVIVEKIRFYHERSVLISGKYNRQALSIAYTKIFKGRRKEIVDSLLKKDINMAKLREYEAIKRDMNFYMQDQRVDRQDIIDEFEAELINKGLMKESGELSNELEEAIAARREIADTFLVKIPILVFAWDIFRFLLIKPYRERRYASIIPGLQPVPEKTQLEKVLYILSNKSVVEIARKFLDNEIQRIDNSVEIIFKKFYLEEILKDYLKVTSSRAVGGVSVYLYSSTEIEDSARLVSATSDELKDVLKILMRLGRRDAMPEEKIEKLEEVMEIKTSEKAMEFLRLV